MRKNQTVVKVLEPWVDDQGNLLDKDGEIVDPSRKKGKQQEPVLIEQLYYLLHWGLTYEILVDNQQRYPVSYTVGICQHTKTGEIKSFIPSDLTVIGKEIQ